MPRHVLDIRVANDDQNVENGDDQETEDAGGQRELGQRRNNEDCGGLEEGEELDVHEVDNEQEEEQPTRRSQRERRPPVWYGDYYVD